MSEIGYKTYRMIDEQSFLSRFEHVGECLVTRQGLKQYRCKCPAHASQGVNHKNMIVSFARDGRILMHCYGGCGAGEILSAIGLSWQDIMPDAPQEAHRSPLQPPAMGKGYRDTLLELAKAQNASQRLSRADEIRAFREWKRNRDEVEFPVQERKGV